MPATNEPAISSRQRCCKRYRLRSLIVDFASSIRRYLIVATLRFDLFNKAAINHHAQTTVDVLTGEPHIKRDHARLLRWQHLAVGEGRQDLIVSSAHPLGEIPDIHCCISVQLRPLSLSLYTHYEVISNHLIVISFKWLGDRGVRNDLSGELGDEEEAPGRRDSARPEGRGTTTMSTDNPATLKSRQGQTQGIEADTTDNIVADLQCGGWGGWDARDVLAGRVDDATVRQAVEVQR